MGKRDGNKYKIEIETEHVEFSSPIFHKLAIDYYNFVQGYIPDWPSPVPYALLCRAIELEQIRLNVGHSLQP